MRYIPLISLLSLLSFGSSCAYFNTLFNAKRLYHKAERIRRESEQEKLSGSAQSLYDQVIKKTAKVLKFYPTHACVDEALFVMGMAFYRQGEYPKALRKFKELTVQYPNSKFTARGFLGMGLVFYAQNDYPKATEIFGKLLTSNDLGDTKKVRDDALFMMALLARDHAGDYEDAIKIFSQVITEYRRSEHKQTAQFRIAECRFGQKKYLKAYEEYCKASKYRYIKTMAYRSKYQMGECLLQIGKYNEARDWCNELLKNEKYEDYYPELKLQIARSYEYQGDLDATLLTYENIISEHKKSKEVADAHYAMGILYRDVLKNFGRAEIAFGKAGAAFTNETLKQEALRNKRNIESYNFLIKDIFKTKNDSASIPSRFKLAELYLFEFDRPDSALSQYLFIKEKFPQHKSAPQAIYALAWVTEYKLKDKARADVLYNTLFETWPQEAFTDSVRVRLGMVLQGQDDAQKARSLFIATEIKRLEGVEAPIAIAASYYNIAHEYPEADIAPQAAYVAAWMYDYSLGDTAQARKTYKLVADTYPHTDYGKRAVIKLAAHPLLSDSAALVAETSQKELEKEKMKEALQNKSKQYDELFDAQEVTSALKDTTLPQNINTINGKPVSRIKGKRKTSQSSVDTIGVSVKQVPVPLEKDH